ncbi:hypothetical protein NPA07_04360 [Mycoplasmopsis caviae]|uniref:Uncharacterized protein n=1 Tax=Mycoplasmopsis caviae TaxID=55603 RepID=A0A3P8LIB0_9BACT|nr:hypothetical protein [Mycoplasmopsis caviae]UUD35011.1 hypothetical protein NPA07_04360 [Mycoplasmopsis caviae]VDR42162.1 Uncharacterised protein [Mycoplasmopsis caviae]
MDNQKEKKVHIIFWCLTLILGLLSLSFFNYKNTRFAVALGYLIGSASGFLAYELRNLLSYKIIVSNKPRAFALGFGGTLLNMVWIGLLLFALFKINSSALNNPYSSKIERNSFWPINIVAFIPGFLTFYISIFIVYVGSKDK